MNPDKFYNGGPCKYGHTLRLKSNRSCYECAKVAPHKRRYDLRRRGIPEPLYPEPKVCECCGRPEPTRALAVDHCHESGKFRGWLCTQCNTGMGKLGDNIAGLKKALAYLERAEV